MKKKDKKVNSHKIDEIKEALDVVESVERTTSAVEQVQRVISDTIYVRDNIAVDLKNFSTMSVSDPTKI